MAPRSERFFNAKPLILTSTPALERLPASIIFALDNAENNFQATIVMINEPYFRAEN